jgi:hypothetical protein
MANQTTKQRHTYLLDSVSRVGTGVGVGCLTICKGVGFLQVTNLSNFSYECQCMHVGAIVMVVKQGWHFCSTKIMLPEQYKRYWRVVSIPPVGAPLNFLGAPLKNP